MCVVSFRGVGVKRESYPGRVEKRKVEPAAAIHELAHLEAFLARGAEKKGAVRHLVWRRLGALWLSLPLGARGQQNMCGIRDQ